MNTFPTSRPVWFVLIAIGALAAAAQLYATTRGIGTTPDSRMYVEAARSFAVDGSITNTSGGTPTPLIHFPPLLPVVLGAPILGAVDALDAVRWLNSLALFATIVLAGLLINELSSHSRHMVIAGAALTAGLMASFFIYIWAWSEPLFIILILSMFLSLTRYEKGRQLHYIALAGLFGSLAWLARYVGGAFVLSVTLWLLLQSGPFRDRLRRAAVFVVVAAIPMGVWLIRNFAGAGQPTDRVAGFHPVSAAAVIEAFGTGFVRLAFSIGLAILIGYCLRIDLRAAWSRASRRPMINCLWASVLIYVLSLLVSISFFDSTTGLDNRMLSPALILLIVALFSTAAHISIPDSRVWPQRLAAAFYSAYLLAGIFGTLVLVSRSHRDGIGFASRTWKNSAAIEYIRALPSDKPVYSNGEEAIYLLTGKSTRALPRTTAADLEKETQAMRDDIQKTDGVVVVFSELENRTFVTRNDLAQALPPMAALQLSDAVVLTVKRDR